MHIALVGALNKNPTSSLDSESHAGLMAHPGRLRRPASLRLFPFCRSEPFPPLGCQMQVRTESRAERSLQPLPVCSKVFIAQTQRGPISCLTVGSQAKGYLSQNEPGQD